jgi:hypothetical protein
MYPISESFLSVLETDILVRPDPFKFKRSRGASDDYQEIIRHLERLESIFSDFENFKFPGDDPEIVSFVIP